MNTLREVFDPQFLLRNSVYISLLIGLVCPLLGTFLVMRRMIFLGVALPQISSAGVALALSLHVWTGHYDGTHGTEEQGLVMLGSMGVTMIAIVGLAIGERRGRGRSEGRIGTLYVLAAAASFLLVAKCPQAEQGWMHLFKGEIIAIPGSTLAYTAACFAAVLLLLGIFRKELLLVSYDADTALVLGKKVLFWDILLYLLVGVTISVAVLSVGPLITFGFLLIPPLTAHLFVRTMRQFAVVSAAIGLTAAMVGFLIAYHWDLPVGPTDVALLGVGYLAAFAVSRLTARWRGATS